MFSLVGRLVGLEVVADWDRQVETQDRQEPWEEVTKFNLHSYIKNYYMENQAEKRVESIEKEVREIKENHLAHIKEVLAVVKTNQEWIMKFFWIVSSASIAGLITGIINLMIK